MVSDLATYFSENKQNSIQEVLNVLTSLSSETPQLFTGLDFVTTDMAPGDYTKACKMYQGVEYVVRLCPEAITDRLLKNTIVAYSKISGVEVDLRPKGLTGFLQDMEIDDFFPDSSYIYEISKSNRKMLQFWTWNYVGGIHLVEDRFAYRQWRT